ncbi:low molecular weight phosphatase family protein [Gordonia hankookensis]|uniref:Low molecular weight phosphatase family protein n=1 Tax=Gordonia hankookensis TaxID=589403 RepID=A0ABR7WH75_9ACTN|nr:low molecular weight phosphatase family protein [Gordonia hankookensis]MBD1322119.1 low molecular weight phosphatase family protein [Gordonia hankookensis]
MSEPTKALFVCVSNRGKSVMAERLTPTVTDRVVASSAGTSAKTGAQMNELSAHVLAEVGVDTGHHQPRRLTEELMLAADLVIVVGTAEVAAPVGVDLQVWNIDEPARRGIDGIDRMRLVRDDITARIRALAADLE